MRIYLFLIILITSVSGHSATWLTNVRGYTTSAEGLSEFSAIVFEDGRILAVGDADIGKKFPDAVRIDGKGRSLLPGLIDAHGHVSGLGFAAERIDLMDTASLEAAVAAVEAFASSHRDTAWLLGRGWNQVLWDTPEFPTSADLDRVVADRPVWLRRVDGHAGWANSRALQAAGITADTETPHGGRILKRGDGKPSGVFVDAAMELIERAIPPPDVDDYERVIANALKRLAALGITSVHDAGVPIVEANVYKALAKNRALPIRVYAMLAGADENLEQFGEPLHDYGGGFLTIASVKLYADGALGSRGAALIEDYSDEPGNRGLLFADVDALAAAIARSNRAGFQANIHAIGDLANRVVLDAFDKVQAAKPSPLRNRIEHAQIVSVADIPRFAELGIIASMQPIHASSDKNMAEDRVGAERILGGYAWQQMLEHGIAIAGGSDFPVEPPNPAYGLHAAVTRRDRDEQPPDGWYPDESLTREQALRAFTYDAAYAAGQEEIIGELAPGKRADFIITDRDYFTMPAEDIDNLRVLETWVDGKRIYEASQEASKP